MRFTYFGYSGLCNQRFAGEITQPDNVVIPAAQIEVKELINYSYSTVAGGFEVMS